MILADHKVSLELDDDSGALVRLGWHQDERPSVSAKGATPVVLRLPGGVQRPLDGLTSLAAGSASARLEWQAGPYHIEGLIDVRDGEVHFRPRVSWPMEADPVAALEWPLIAGAGPLQADGSDDVLLHPFATGFLFRDPYRLFTPGDPGPGGGLRWCPYPEGYAGATMQMVALVGPGHGLQLVAQDPAGHLKWLNGYLDDERRLTLSVGHGNEDRRHPAISPGYDTVLSRVGGGSWLPAAESYRRWANRQPWCGRGWLRHQADRPAWLHEQTGLVTFGLNLAHDRRRWVDEFARIAGPSVLHISGPNWTPGQDYMGHTPGPLEEWFPARVHGPTLDRLRGHGHRLAPFIFDSLVGSDEAARGPVPSRMEIPREGLARDTYRFDFRCPATPQARHLHRERDTRVVGELLADAVYYDISAHNVIKECLAPDHEHPPGGGRALSDGFLRLHRESRLATRESFGRVVAQGTELINETHVGSVDMYQARAEASPAASLESDIFHAWIKAGRVEKVPLFTFVYHEYGPVRTDGWSKLSQEQGDYFHAVAGRVLVWGGLFQLNYEYSPLEMVDGHPEPEGQHYYTFPDGSLAPRPYPVDEEKVAAIGALVRLRTRIATDHLAYGRMLPSPQLAAERIGLSWFHYNGPKRSPAYEDRGVAEVDAIQCGAWELPEGRAAVLFNADARTHEVDLADLVDGLATGTPSHIELITSEGRTIPHRGLRRLPVAPRRGVVVKLRGA